mgnify:CR=1 FL=1
MWISIIIITVLAVLIAYFERKERLEDKAVLHHTISVNLGILQRELIELNTAAESSTLSDKPAATALLLQSGKDAAFIESTMNSASRTKLQELLTLTFAAMNKATEARHLLNACHPF